MSYVRLFALGLSGGILAGVFNSLAVGMSPDNVIAGPIVMVLIFVIGHAINIFMNVLGAMVHPMRLTFVEFFKNSGYEGGGKMCIRDRLITASVKDFAQDKDYLNAFIVALASKWSIDEPIVISTADAESLKKYFAAHAKALLDKGVTIQQVNGIKTLFTVSPADGSYKVNFGEEEFMNYFKAFLRPQLVEMLFRCV